MQAQVSVRCDVCNTSRAQSKQSERARRCVHRDESAYILCILLYHHRPSHASETSVGKQAPLPCRSPLNTSCSISPYSPTTWRSTSRPPACVRLPACITPLVLRVTRRILYLSYVQANSRLLVRLCRSLLVFFACSCLPGFELDETLSARLVHDAVAAGAAADRVARG